MPYNELRRQQHLLISLVLQPEIIWNRDDNISLNHGRQTGLSVTVIGRPYIRLQTSTLRLCCCNFHKTQCDTVWRSEGDTEVTAKLTCQDAAIFISALNISWHENLPSRLTSSKIVNLYNPIFFVWKCWKSRCCSPSRDSQGKNSLNSSSCHKQQARHFP